MQDAGQRAMERQVARCYGLTRSGSEGVLWLSRRRAYSLTHSQTNGNTRQACL